MKQCESINKGGGQCRAKSTKDSNYCFWHDPTLQKTRMLASKKGGQNRRLQGEYGHEISLQTPFDASKFLGVVINTVWTGKVPVQVGTSIGFLIRCWLDAYEKSEIEAKLNELDERLNKAGL